MESLENPSVLTEAFESLGVLLILAAGFLLIFGATRIAKRFIVIGLLTALFAGFHQVLLDEVAAPFLILITILVVLALLGQFLGLFIGKRAADVAIGNMVSKLFALILLLLFLPVKKLWEHFQSD